MKTWPPELAKLYPLQRRPTDRPPGLDEPHPLRPWWRKPRPGTWRRQDGKAHVQETFHQEFGGPAARRVRYETPEGPETAALDAVVDDVLAEIDAKWPIPRPPYRVGQVWTSHTGSGVGVVATLFGGVLATVVRAAEAPPTFDCMRPETWPYLVHDPCVPDAAPWAPAEAP